MPAFQGSKKELAAERRALRHRDNASQDLTLLRFEESNEQTRINRNKKKEKECVSVRICKSAGEEGRKDSHLRWL